MHTDAHIDLLIRRAAASYRRHNGVLPLDMQSALENAGLVIEDVINHINNEEA